MISAMLLRAPRALRCTYRHASSRLVLALAAMLALASVATHSPAQQATSVDIGRVRPGSVSVTTLGIPLFRPKTQRDAVLAAGLFREGIYRAVEPTGYFRRPANMAAVDAAVDPWNQSQRRDFSGFRRTGSEVVVIGLYEVVNGQVTADVLVYDVATATRIFGNRYAAPQADVQLISRRIADDLLRYIAMEQGVSDSLVAFVSDRSGYKEVWLMKADGSNQQQFTNERSLVTAPTFGARGTEIYFTSYRQFNPDLYGMRLDRSNSWMISAQPGGNFSPAWHEANQRLAAVLMKDGNSEIYMMDRSGGGRQRLTNHRAIDASPVWSPDGSRIAFTSQRAGSPQIFVMNANGSGVQRLTFQGNYNTEPAWSPDGTRIAYVSRIRGVQQIMVMDVATRTPTQLTNQGNNEDPTWAPNGQYLAFSSNRTGRWQIYRMRADGSQQVQLTSQGNNISPSWGPVATAP